MYMRLPLFLFIFFSSFSSVFAQNPGTPVDQATKEVSHSFYITSNIGNVPFEDADKILSEINKNSQKDPSTTLLLLGNVTEQGYLEKKGKRKHIKVDLQKLMDTWNGFNGKIILTPGENEWKKSAPQSIDDLESFLQNQEKVDFWPNDGCPLEREDINDEIVLEIVDSQWFLEDWDNQPYINEKCEHKTRDQFLAEFKDDLKDSQGKTVIVAVYQPVMSNTKISVVDKMGGFSPQSYQNQQNRILRGRLETIASQFEDVIFVSGKDRNLQYLSDDAIPQIISGAVGETEKAKARKEEHFESNRNGYSKLTVFKNGSSVVDIFAVENGTSIKLFSKQIKRERPTLQEVDYEAADPSQKTKKAAIYTPEETKKTGFYKTIWGDHYRDNYSKPIEAPILFIDSLPNNVRPISEGGGTQSRSLRLIDDNEHEYTLRALRKSAVRFLQATAIKDHYVEDYLKNTVAERYLLDFYTTSHPYAQFSMNELSETLEVLHANPKIYYVPKQRGLGIYNEDYGDELYMLEEHVGDENKSFETFGSPNDILSTSDLRLELRESKDSYVDEPAYIKARLFDMLVGNWDRHQDQWRWAEYETDDDKKRYEAIPRDWDQAFPKYDGAIISLAKFAFPLLRKMQSFDADIKNVKWFNYSGYPLDKAFIKKANWEDWKSQVDFIQENLSDKAIDAAFKTLPEAAQDSTITSIKKKLALRRDNLETIAQSYYDYLNDFEVVLGTKEDDHFLITRKEGGTTEISISNEKGETIFTNTYTAEQTGEIWVYGLDGNDTFQVNGNGEKPIKIKIMGGKENDTYDFENTAKVKLYDYKSKENTIVNPRSKKWLTDSYKINTYDYEKRKYNENIVLPSIGYDADTGFSMGLKDQFSTYGLATNPFSTQHTIAAAYYFATQGFAVDYSMEFAHIFYNWNLGLDLRYSSPNFTMNYFGTGNDSFYDEDSDRDVNRVRIKQWKVSPYLVHTNAGSSYYVRSTLESNEVTNDDNRFVGQVFAPDNDVFEQQRYASAEIGYNYLNQNNPAFPNRGLEADVVAGYTTNIDGYGNRFGYLKPTLSLVYPLHPSGIAVIATKLGGQALFGNDYEFYHGAVLGGNTTLRAYRNERFNGKNAFYQSTDIRVGISRFKTNFVPLQLGVSLGFDYGRVWSTDDDSNQWHNDFGGSIWISGFSALTGNLGLYHGAEGNRFMFSLGFSF